MNSNNFSANKLIGSIWSGYDELYIVVDSQEPDKNPRLVSLSQSKQLTTGREGDLMEYLLFHIFMKYIGQFNELFDPESVKAEFPYDA